MNSTINITKAFRIIGVAWLILTSVLFLTSCSNGTPPKKDAKESAEEHNDAKFAGNQEEKDAQYLVDAYSNGLYEIEASQHARQKATRNDVKELASLMIEDHAKLNESIKSLSTAKQVSLQQGLTEDQLKQIKECQDKKGADYDEAYVKKLIKNHEEAIKMAEQAADKATDNEIRNLFSSTLPSFRHHLEIAMSIQDKMNKR
jgi:putative membrane protein